MVLYSKSSISIGVAIHEAAYSRNAMASSDVGNPLHGAQAAHSDVRGTSVYTCFITPRINIFTELINFLVKQIT
jgi:hypothetical protein